VVVTDPDIEPEGVVTEPEAEDEDEPVAPLDGEELDELLLEGGVAEVDGAFLPSSRPHAASASAAATAMRSALLMGVPLNGDGAAILKSACDTKIGV
jgi:hypothetical protein